MFTGFHLGMRRLQENGIKKSYDLATEALRNNNAGNDVHKSASVGKEAKTSATKKLGGEVLETLLAVSKGCFCVALKVGQLSGGRPSRLRLIKPMSTMPAPRAANVEGSGALLN